MNVHSVEPFGMIHSSGLKFQSSCLLNFLKIIILNIILILAIFMCISVRALKKAIVFCFSSL